MRAGVAVARLRSRPLSEVFALVPICQTRRPSARTLRYGAELGRARCAQGHRPDRPRTGVTRGGSKNNLGSASNRRDRTSGPPGPGPRVPRASPRGGFVASSATGAIVSATVASSDPSLLSVGACYGLTDARRVEWRIASLHGRPAPTRRARFRTSGAAWSPRYYLRSAVDARFVASGGWWAFFRTETAYCPRFLSGSTFGTTTVRWKASQFSRDS